jgi:MinD-like ATPase involved in chromosome partitioning or flagellar assembly
LIVVVASIKGAPGVTTTATALATAWPTGRRVLLVEADPFGGDLAAWSGVAPSSGLWSLLAAGRRGLNSEAVWKHAANLPAGLPILYGLASADQAVANEAAWPVVAEALAALEADVVIDAGRLLPHFAGGIGPLLSVADVLMLLCPPTLAGIVHLKTFLPALSALPSSMRLMVQPTGQRGFSSDEIASTLSVNVAPPIPHDAKGATALSENAPGWATRKSVLAKWARSCAAELAASCAGTAETAAATQVPLSDSEIGTHTLGPPLTETEYHNASERPHDTEHRNDTESSAAPTGVAQ